MPCVGLVVLAGCLCFVLAPDEEVPLEARSGAVIVEQLPTVVIDAGHGGRDEGAKSNGLVEKELTLDLAQRLEKRLQGAGFRTVMTRRDDSHVGLAERAELANRVEHSIFVSIHFNQSPYRSASGVETFYAREKVPEESLWTWVGFFSTPSSIDERSEVLAGFVQTELATRAEANNRGAKGGALYVVRHVRAPAVLIECGFLSNAWEAKLLSNPSYRDRLAAAIVEGVVEFERGEPLPKARPTELARSLQ